MKDIFLYDIWCLLRDSLGFEGATAVLYIGFFISLVACVWYIRRTIRHYLQEE